VIRDLWSACICSNRVLYKNPAVYKNPVSISRKLPDFCRPSDYELIGSALIARRACVRRKQAPAVL